MTKHWLPPEKKTVVLTFPRGYVADSFVLKAIAVL